MGLIVGILLVVLALTARLCNRYIYNPGTIFCGVWGIIVVLTSLHLNDLAEVNDVVYLYIVLGNVGFLGGHFAGLKTGIKGREKKENILHVLNKVFYIALTMAIIIFIIYIMPKLYLYGMGFSLSEVRYGEMLDSQSVNSLMEIIVTHFAYPTIEAAIFLLLCKGFLDKKDKMFLLPIILVALLILGYGAREIIIYTFVIILMSIIIFKKRDIKIDSKYYVVGIGVIILFVAVTISRGENVKVLDSLYRYICGSQVLFSYTLENMDVYYLSKTDGMLSILGFVRPVYNFFSLLGGNVAEVFNEAEKFQVLLQNTIIQVDYTGKRFNYFSTCFAYFYKDLGVLGIILFSAIYGGIATSVYKKMVSRPNDLRCFAIYVFLVCGFVASMMDFQFINIRNALPIIYMILYTYTKRNVFDKRM